METEQILGLINYTIPAILMGGIAMYFFKKQMQNEERRRTYLLLKSKQSQALPLRLQAYERLALFLERISPAKLQVRVVPNGNDKFKYQNKLIQTITQEFEHNLAQQIYVSDTCWNVIVTSKNASIKKIISVNSETSVENAHQLRESILQDAIDNESPVNTALTYLKNEVRKMY
jgi:hypothetical protein